MNNTWTSLKKAVMVYLATRLILLPASADVIFPMTFALLPLLPLIIATEVVIAPFVSRNLNIDRSFGYILIVVFFANAVSSAFGFLVPTPHSLNISVFVLTAFIYSTLLEGAFYRLFAKIPVIKSLEFSAILNIISYALITGYMIVKLGRI